MKWDKPQIVSDMDYAFGSKENMRTLLPSMAEIPEEFKAPRGHGEVAQKWIQVVDDWFFKGVKIESVVMKNGIDRRVATRHLGCILHSYEPRHEHKVAGVAYLMSLWFEELKYTSEGVNT